MSQLIYGQEDDLLPWAQERVGVTFRRDAYSLGLMKANELVAVCVFDGFSEVDCNIHIASDGSSQWLNKKFLVSVFSYPFIQLNMNRVTAMVPAKNKAALRFDEHLGFVREGLHPKACRDDDLITLGMLKENCRFIPRGDSHV